MVHLSSRNASISELIVKKFDKGHIKSNGQISFVFLTWLLQIFISLLISDTATKFWVTSQNGFSAEFQNILKNSMVVKSKEMTPKMYM